MWRTIAFGVGIRKVSCAAAWGSNATISPLDASPYHRRPSGPIAMPYGCPLAVGVAYSSNARVAGS